MNSLCHVPPEISPGAIFLRFHLAHALISIPWLTQFISNLSYISLLFISRFFASFLFLMFFLPLFLTNYKTLPPHAPFVNETSNMSILSSETRKNNPPNDLFYFDS